MGIIAMYARSARDRLYDQYSSKIVVDRELNRRLVSFQGDKEAPLYRWLKYKEAFSSALVRHLLAPLAGEFNTDPTLLDPFAGAGTALTVAAGMGWSSIGIELLPIGVAAANARRAAGMVDPADFQRWADRAVRLPFDQPVSDAFRFRHLPITRGAFPKRTEHCLSAYMAFVQRIGDPHLRLLFRFACLAILEEISYTRKDGQYLRWDSRAHRKAKSAFRKGEISSFPQALTSKLHQMLDDLRATRPSTPAADFRLIEGSCLDKLPRIPSDSVDVVITSPPYANRYDYTRTYALELAFLGLGPEDVKALRQNLLSCTVENKSKQRQLLGQYQGRNDAGFYRDAEKAFDEQAALHEVLDILNQARTRGVLNNGNIPRLVYNYFFEMNLVIRELARILRRNGKLFMVNDNVRYFGEELPVDLILSDFALKAGLHVDAVRCLPTGKGNSSQQMGIHGKNELRKCVYCWSKRGEEMQAHGKQTSHQGQETTRKRMKMI